MTEFILGTAGHIDHGKTSLVKALTGTDCDRLPEEKSRGITIDIGFAELQLGDIRLGIVDVPGHERFIKNMLAGATGIDLGLLVVAADDSIMPQTREHLEILEILGVRQIVVAITKCDVVDRTTAEVVALEVRELLAKSTIKSAPIILTSCNTGIGLPELKAAIADTCRSMSREARTDVEEPFRMAIDRAFVLQGHGTVVTGSVTSGLARVGSELEWLPSRSRVRVRTLHNHDRPVNEVRRGMRAAINLAGVDHAEVKRGQELAAPFYLRPSRTLTVQIKASANYRRPIKHRAPVRLHIGSSEVMAIISLLEADSLVPGPTGFAQLFLKEPVAAIWNQPFVIRRSSAEGTIGGGQVLQPVARKIRRADEAALRRLRWLADPNAPADRVQAVAWSRGHAGFSEDELAAEAGIFGPKASELVKQLQQQGVLVEMAVGTRKVVLHSNALEELNTRILEVIGKMHASEPLLTSHDRNRVIARLEYLGDDSLVGAILDRLIATGTLVGDARRVARADFRPKLSANQRKLKDAIVAAHGAAGFQPPEPASFAAQAAGNAASLKDLFDVAVAEGLLVKISDAIYLHADTDADMRRRITRKLAEQRNGLTVAEIRDMLGTTRKFAVPLCEYLDRAGLTRRIGDLRVQAQGNAPTGE